MERGAALRRGATTAAVALVAVSCSAGEGQAPGAPRLAERPQESIAMWSSDSAYEIVALDAAARPVDASPTVLTPPLEGKATPGLFVRPAWSPDGERLAFTIENDGDAAAPFSTDIVVMQADGSNPRRLTDSKLAVHPVWSPDGRTIAFARRIATSLHPPEKRFGASIWTIPAEGGEPRELVPRETSAPTSDVPGSWSPDGSLIAFTRITLEDADRGELRFEVYVVRPDGSGVRRLIEDAGEPAWSPDGRHVAFVSGRDGNGELSYGDRTSVANELYVADADGSDVRRLTDTHAVNEQSPAWSPDGTRIAFTRGVVFGNAEATSVMLVNADGSCPTVLAGADAETGGAWYANPAWRPAESPVRFEPECA